MTVAVRCCVPFVTLACDNHTTIRRPKYHYVGIIFMFVAASYIFINSYGFWQKNDESFKPKSQLPDENWTSSEDREYVVIIDAGSSGSRVFIYSWPPHSGTPNQLLHIRPLCGSNGEPIVKKVEPGLSSVSEQPWNADVYIYPLLEFASSHIPPDKHKMTPLYILATAGLRLLDVSAQTAILEDLKEDIPKNFSFRITENSAEVISGQQEGIFQWIAINYVLGRFNHNSSGPITAIDVTDRQSQTPIFRKKTVGILDMGGASMQLAIELTSKAQVGAIQQEKKATVTEINLGCNDHTYDHLYHVYVTTYLGMGANEMRDHYEEYLVEKLANRGANETQKLGTSDPCLPIGLNLTLSISSHSPPFKASSNNESQPESSVLLGSGNYDGCKESLRPLLQRIFNCAGTPCLAAQLPMYFEANDFYGFSEFWYSMEDVLRIGGSYQYYKFRKAAKNFCATPWSIHESRFRNHEYPLADRNRLKYQCFKSAWLAVALHDGLGLPLDFSRLRSSPNTVKGDVVHWTLGAAILKTRFLPLREIQKGNSHVLNKARGSVWIIHLNNFSLVISFTVVFAAIFLYLQQLQCLKRVRFANTSSTQALLPLTDRYSDS